MNFNFEPLCCKNSSATLLDFQPVTLGMNHVKFYFRENYLELAWKLFFLTNRMVSQVIIFADFYYF